MRPSIVGVDVSLVSRETAYVPWGRVPARLRVCQSRGNMFPPHKCAHFSRWMLLALFILAPTLHIETALHTWK